MDIPADDIDLVRALNRDWTRALGLLGRNYLGSGLGVAEARVLFELALGGGGSAREVSGRLGMDEGHMSRILGQFEQHGWLSRPPDPQDGRRRTIAMTDAGRAAMARLEAASRADIAARLTRMPEAGRLVLLDAARHAAPIRAEEVALRDLQAGDAGWITQRHGTLYARDEGYDLSFEALVAGIVAGFLTTRVAGRDRAWIACRGAERLGSIFCVHEDADTARLRLFLLEPKARGIGLGRRMLETCLNHARAFGYNRMVLWTHKSHAAACGLYAATGFRMTGQQPAQAFGRSVIDQIWELDL
ncbi:helix-turn-helix domain-containing GNAT family N-acetyltransferase [Defluviimonas sp. WL0075]|uniref:bifunctional helix-turn-helix transcriptional regulator/GNAT family N-acetyltransferase n=1 Tax=Albidovulum sediminicola TaxID=2984331 RepID=UPI002982606F|nr:helix-turn-helix domain-containing GNAT family N-acetyltransferase [Defluviimonas sp. WL0075]